jgi:prepilin peptidase CpaA
MDGPDELAFAVGKGFGGICFASGFFGAFDDAGAAVEEESTGSGRKSGDFGQAREGGAGPFRHLSRGLVSRKIMTTQVWIAVLVGLAATVDDLARRKIANWIPAAALAGGFGWQIGQDGWAGALHALTGAAAGFAVFLAFYLLGGMGGGDVKLMAGFGALLGTGRLIEAALWTAGVGGLLALGAVVYQSVRRRLGSGKRIETSEEKERGNSIPYAPAITLGVWLSLVPKG